MTPQQIEALKLALEALELINIEFICRNGSHHKKEDRHEWDEDCPITNRWRKAITALKEALAEHAMREVQRLGQEIEQDYTYGYASRLAIAIWQKHYMKDAIKWKPLDTTEGVLTQIDNMTCSLVKEKPPQPEQEPVAWMDADGNVSDNNDHKCFPIPLYTKEQP